MSINIRLLLVKIMVMASLPLLNKDRIEVLITERQETSLGNKRVAERQRTAPVVKLIKTKGKVKLPKQVLIRMVKTPKERPKQQHS